MLVDRFSPLPIVSPWNEGSGFAGNGKSKEAEKALAAVESSTDPRLSALKEAVASAREVVDQGRKRGWGAQGDRLWETSTKPQVVQLCRNLLPDESLVWIDTAIATTQDRDGNLTLDFSRLLGTGGNFGRQDLQATYIQRALTVLTDARVQDRNPGWLRSVLFGDEDTPYLRETVGQFDPGRAGGIQSSPGEKADSDGFANPWALLFTLEGAMFFAGAAVRRLGVRSSSASLPFVVQPSTVGYGSRARDENVMAEVWTPQWARPATLPEIEHLFSQARIDWNGSPARTGLDVARAIVSRGVDRGLTRFDRYAIAERLGQNPLAVHVGSVAVAERPGPALTAGLDRWLSSCVRLRRMPGGFLRSIDTAIDEVQGAVYASAADDEASLLTLLAALGRLHRAISTSGRARENIPPLTLTEPHLWIEAIQRSGPGSPALRLAVALASGSDDEPRPPGERMSAARRAPLRALLSPVTVAERPGWSERPTPIPDGDIMSALAEAHRRRGFLSLPEPAQIRDQAIPLRPAVLGHRTGFDYAVPAPLDNVLALLTDDGTDPELAAQFSDLLHGLLLFTWTSTARRRLAPAVVSAGDHPACWAPALFALLAPFYRLAPYAVAWDTESSTTLLLRPNESWAAQLIAGQFHEVAADAARRLKAAGARTVVDPSVVASEASGYGAGFGRRLAAALLIPLAARDYRALLERVIDALHVGTVSRSTADTPDDPSDTDPELPEPVLTEGAPA